MFGIRSYLTALVIIHFMAGNAWAHSEHLLPSIDYRTLPRGHAFLSNSVPPGYQLGALPSAPGVCASNAPVRLSSYWCNALGNGGATQPQVQQILPKADLSANLENILSDLKSSRAREQTATEKELARIKAELDKAEAELDVIAGKIDKLESDGKSETAAQIEKRVSVLEKEAVTRSPIQESPQNVPFLRRTNTKVDPGLLIQSNMRTAILPSDSESGIAVRADTKAFSGFASPNQNGSDTGIRRQERLQREMKKARLRSYAMWATEGVLIGAQEATEILSSIVASRVPVYGPLVMFGSRSVMDVVIGEKSVSKAATDFSVGLGLSQMGVLGDAKTVYEYNYEFKQWLNSKPQW